jgi:hypothetical protein
MSRRQRAGFLVVALALVVLGSGCVTVVRSSVPNGGGAPNGGSALSQARTISDNGRYVVFESAASNLVGGDTNGAQDVFRHDNANGRTIRVSVAGNGAQLPAESWVEAISGDGNHVVFRTTAALAPGDTNGLDDLYVRTITQGTTEWVSVRPDGSPVLQPGPGFRGALHSVSISSTGLLVSYVKGDITSAMFLRDRLAGTTTSPPGDAAESMLSPDGSVLVWNKSCAQVGPCLGDSYVRSLAQGTVERIEDGCGFDAYDVSLGGDFVVGRRFRTQPQLPCDGPFGLVRWNHATDVFVPVPVADWQEDFVTVSDSGRLIGVLSADGYVRVVDMITGHVQDVDTDMFGNPGPGRANSAALSGSGRYISFATLSRLSVDDQDSFDDVFTVYTLRPRAASVQPGSVTRGGPQQLLTIGGSDFLPGAKVAFSGEGINVDSATVTSPTEILVAVTVGSGAPLGERELVVTNNGGHGHADAHCVDCLTVR